MALVYEATMDLCESNKSSAINSCSSSVSSMSTSASPLVSSSSWDDVETDENDVDVAAASVQSQDRLSPSSSPCGSSNNATATAPTSPTSVCSSQSSFIFDRLPPQRSPSNSNKKHIKAKRRDSGRSVSSSTTDWSTSTEAASNTTLSKEEKRQSKSRFMNFAYVLLHLLERKDPARFVKAKEVILNCEEQKRKGHVESVSESVKAPLKDLVGPTYWKQAQSHYTKRMTRHRQQQKEVQKQAPSSSSSLEPLCMTEQGSSLPAFSHDQVACLEQCFTTMPNDQHPKRRKQRQPPQRQERREKLNPLTTVSCTSPEDERKLRKERFWMLIRVLMKYLEKTEPGLYEQSKRIIEGCVQRNKNEKKKHSSSSSHRRRHHRLRSNKSNHRDPHYHDCMSLTRDVQKEVKQLVGVSRWRRAEAYLAKVLVKRAEEDDKAAALAKDSILLSEYDLQITDDCMESFAEEQQGRHDDSIRTLSPSTAGYDYNERQYFWDQPQSNIQYLEGHKGTNSRAPTHGRVHSLPVFPPNATAPVARPSFKRSRSDSNGMSIDMAMVTSDTTMTADLLPSPPSWQGGSGTAAYSNIFDLSKRRRLHTL